MKKRLTSEQVEASTMALAFVRALLLGSNKAQNKAHDINPCPVVVWEDGYTIDDTILPLIKGIDNKRKQ